MILLTLLGPGGHICSPSHVFAYIFANARTGALKGTGLFPIISLEKGTTFFLTQLSSFAGKKLSLLETPKFHGGGDPYKLGQ